MPSCSSYAVPVIICNFRIVNAVAADNLAYPYPLRFERPLFQPMPLFARRTMPFSLIDPGSL